MTKLFLALIIFSSLTWVAADDELNQSQERHVYEEFVDGKNLEVDSTRFDNFIADLSDSKIAVVSVNGMVCDFCARGLEKTFKRDRSVSKIDVDLKNGKVLIAYSNTKKIDLSDIRNRILENGQNVTDIQVLEVE